MSCACWPLSHQSLHPTGSAASSGASSMLFTIGQNFQFWSARVNTLLHRLELSPSSSRKGRSNLEGVADALPHYRITTRRWKVRVASSHSITAGPSCRCVSALQLCGDGGSGQQCRGAIMLRTSVACPSRANHSVIWWEIAKKGSASV